MRIVLVANGWDGAHDIYGWNGWKYVVNETNTFLIEERRESIE